MTSSLASSKGLAVLALATLGIGSIVVANIGGGGEAEPPPPASTPMAATMMRVGLDAGWLAAIGAGSSDTTATIAAAITQHGAGELSLAQADADFAACKPVCTELERKIKSGKGSAEDVTAYQAATADLAVRIAARDAVLDDIFEAGIDELTSAQQAALRTVRANRHWKLPVQYLTVDRTEAEWVALRDSLDARRIFQEQGEEVPAEVTTFLATVESDSVVSGAKASYDSNIAAIQTSWNAAVTD